MKQVDHRGEITAGEYAGMIARYRGHYSYEPA